MIENIDDLINSLEGLDINRVNSAVQRMNQPVIEETDEVEETIF